MKKIFHARSVSGKFVFDEPAAVISTLRKYDDRDIWVSIDTEKKKRSNNQNSYYHGVVLKLLCDNTGYSSQEMHDCLRCKFLGNSLAGRDPELYAPRSTTTLSTVEMEKYLEDIRRWSSVYLSCYIPQPNELEF